MDHLNGIFIIDRVSSAVKMGVQKELKMIKKGAVTQAKDRKAFVL
jgi:hypothetical protein